MSAREDAYLRHRQWRWLRGDAHRWVRADVARYLKPGTDLAKAYPALDRKYSPSQPRVPAGNGIESGRWTARNGEHGPNALAPAGNASPMGNIDFGDLIGSGDLSDLFQITPSDLDLRNFTQLAGDIPDGDGAKLQSNESPDIPTERPATTEGRMGFIRAAAQWVARVGRYSPLVDAYFAALDQVNDIKGLTDAIKSANDPPRTLEELQAYVGTDSQGGYHDHHIVEKTAGLNAGFMEDVIDGHDNLARIPVLKHIDLTADYARIREQPDGTIRSLRDYLQDKNFDVRRSVGLNMMKQYGILK